MRDTPLSETAFVGAGIGAAMGGMRPIVEIMTVNFSLLALDQIVNNAATIPHMSGGQFAVPLVIRMATGAGRQLAAQHSHSLEGWYAHIPGLRVLAPATLEDARGMLLAGARGPEPGADLRAHLLYNMEGELDPDDRRPVDISAARCGAPGTDVTLVTYGGSLCKALEAAAALARGGHRGRGDRPARAAAARHGDRPRVGRARPTGPWSSTRAGGAARFRPRSRIASSRRRSTSSTRRSRRVCSAEVPIPYAEHLEQAALPQPATIAAAARELGEAGVSEFLMPSLGADMEAGTLVEWLKSSPATPCSAATSSRWSRRRRARSRSRSSRRA